MSPRDRGFTIIELLIALLLGSILGTMGISAYKGTERIELMTTANNIQSLIRVAQARAYGQGNTHTVGFDPTLGECLHINNSKIIDSVVVKGKTYIKKTNFPKGNLYFRGKLSPSQGGTIVLNSKSYEVEITVLPVTGRVKIYPITRK